jgi:monoamine oxidase
MKNSRRQFTILGAATLAASLIPKLTWAVVKPLSRKNPKKVLIIGAGVSGLYAADLLINRGFDVQILEASARLGGRVFGGQIGSTKFDLGGQAFTKDMHRVKMLGKKFGFHSIHKPEQSAFFLQGNKLLTGDDLQVVRDGVEDLSLEVTKLKQDLQSPEQRARFASTSVMSWAKSIVDSAAEDYFRQSFTSEYCEAPENVSLLHYLETENAYSGDANEMDFRFREGMFGLAEALGRHVKKHIAFNCPVEKIDCSESSVIATSRSAKWKADFAILALSPVQMRHIQLTGVDSKDFQTAVAPYQSAAVRKILAVYDKPFWKGRACEGDISPPIGMSMLDNSDLEKKIYSLVIFIGGPLARQAMTQADVLEKIAAVIGPAAKTPLHYHEQAWLPSDYLPGGYSATRKIEAIAPQSLPTQLGRIFIAGSETSEQFPSYVEGALCSAERAVQLIEKKIGNQ